MAIKRSKTLDVLRGLLFVLMANTHAMSLTGIDRSHWLFSDWWLPNGWATVVYVVLSGYGIGRIFADRHPPEKHMPLLRYRSGTIFAVMLASNIFFAAVKLAQEGALSTIFTPGWWIGYITLDTPWSISGVLLPTVLVLLCAPMLIRCCNKWRWKSLAVLVISQLVMTLAVIASNASGDTSSWAARFFLHEGLGGFPVLPFVLNGFIGCWLGIYHRQNEPMWLYCVSLLLLLQIGVYASTFMPSAWYLGIFRAAVGASGKFAWLFLCASILGRWGYGPLISPIALIGKFALTTFVAHRIFLQAINTLINGLNLSGLPAELRYVTLWIGTLSLTWFMCQFLQRRYNRTALSRLSQNKLTAKEDYFTR